MSKKKEMNVEAAIKELQATVAAQLAAQAKVLTAHDAKIEAITAERTSFLSSTTARDLLETHKLIVVSGERLPWAASRLPVMLKHEDNDTTTKQEEEEDTSPTPSLFATLPTTPVTLSEKKHLQPWLSQKTPNIDQDTFEVSWVDGHETPSIGTRKPDIVHYPKGRSPSVYELAYVGDLKGQTAGTSGSPIDEAIACLMDFLCALAAVQVWRRLFIGYLVDGKHISFFVFEFDFSPKRGDKRALVRNRIVALGLL
jgi:hypothetical protein